MNDSQKGKSLAKGAKKRTSWGEDVDSSKGMRGERERLLFETAAKLFNSHGFHGTSMSQLTSELGLTKGAIYYYVTDKSDLLYKLHLKSIEATQRANTRGIAEGRNGLERVKLIIRYYVEALTRSQTETFILLEKGALNEEQTRDIKKRRKQLENELRDQIVTGFEDGSMTSCDPKLATFNLVGAMAWVSKWYDPEGEWNPEQVAQSMADMLIRSIAAKPVDALTTDVSKV
ncbi:TetR/AcrR family transcriptional regulator [Sphingorhabdus sp. SMR4y]|uniref:TetR/AcrR family transcriptional regulator n=1 Tax=Sphingorhabdus sp. SMR4y TaxID=2584094 RepID=UPI000B5C67AD|nr:TetR/AcrR family transcriptional regulator [Sphingorhabdus sp. SMR4y]ASK89713.1 HTH-type transcriptional repressor KstR2 [Sphingorhabdus sp. SMR4y]